MSRTADSAATAAASRDMYIRPARPSDAPAMVRIAFLVGDSGQTAEGKMNYEDLPGLIYVLPYVTPLPGGGGRIEGTTGFVLVERCPVTKKEEVEKKNLDDGEIEYEEIIAGFSLLATDSLAYRAAVEQYWWPTLRARFPLNSDVRGLESSGESKPYTELDEYFLDRFHRPNPISPACLAFSPAHMHINILPAYHRQGWGRKLVAVVVEQARTVEGVNGLFLGYMPDNLNAARFYHRIGFRHEHVEGAPLTYVGLKFEDFV